MDTRKPKINYIINFAERLIEDKHPASNDLNVYLTTIKIEANWLQQLMYLLGLHTNALIEYEKVIIIFFLNYYSNSI